MFCVLAAWGYPAGARRGRLWALEAAPSDDAVAWKAFLDRLPGRPALVVYDSDKAIDAAVRRRWPTVPVHLCEHHLYVNAKKHLREDGQEGWGNTYRTLLAAAGQSLEGWAAFRNAVLAEPILMDTGRWVRFWDAQMTAQAARRGSMPPHYSTGALDPHIALVRQQLARRRWTFRNLPRMNALLGLVRLHVNRRDVTSEWAKLLACAVTTEQTAWAATAEDRRRKRPRASLLNEEPTVLLDGSRAYSLRKHLVPPRDRQTQDH
jgi:transposase-like protein